jgi:hypothetical protein
MSARNLPVPTNRLNAIRDTHGLLARITGRRDLSEPVAAWRSVPEAALTAISDGEKSAYIRALLPLMTRGRRLERANLRRLYQLFAFMEMPAASRQEFLLALEDAPRFVPESVPMFRDWRVRQSLIDEAAAFASHARSREAVQYVDSLRIHLKVKSISSRKLTRLFEKLTDLENRAATVMGKRGHLVRLDDRRLEIFKKSVAAVGVPSAVLFPLGTVGLSAEGITTGLMALGGGFLLPAGLAMITGLGALVAVGITSKRLLDLMMPTIDADRASIDVQQLRRGVVEIERLLDEVAGEGAGSAALQRAQERITSIIGRIAPLTQAQRAQILAGLEYAHTLGARYLGYLADDRAALEARGHNVARDIGELRQRDLPVITGFSSSSQVGGVSELGALD